MKNLVYAALLALLILGICKLASADSFEDYTVQQVSQCDNYLVTRVSVTDTSSSVTFTKDTKAIYVENLDATNEAWIDFDDDVATAGSSDEIRLDAGKNRFIAGFKTRSIGLITSSAETATVQVESCS